MALVPLSVAGLGVTVVVVTLGEFIPRQWFYNFRSKWNRYK